MSRYAIIPARGGSKRLPRKNVRSFMGKPIIAHSIATAQASGLFATVYVSTEDAEIAQVAREYGAAVLDRPAHLADDLAGTPEVMQHHATEFQFRGASFLCCIYPTAPLMTVEDLHTGLTELKGYGADFAFSVGTDPLCDAGQWYWGKTHAFAEGRQLFGPDSLMIPLPRERVCDINVEKDWLRAELLYAAMHRKAA